MLKSSGTKDFISPFATNAFLHGLTRIQTVNSVAEAVRLNVASVFFNSITRSSAPWLTSTVKWFDDFCADDYLGNLEQEVTESVERVQGLYMAAQAGVQQIHKVYLRP